MRKQSAVSEADSSASQALVWFRRGLLFGGVTGVALFDPEAIAGGGFSVLVAEGDGLPGAS
ncbi:hypothetical protein [Noviherbaspirillum galbum]|uniref:hypothetical protein n=1 Tax=Noviherbaspirillum galbum TaxID=2709383 RepID=UPI002E2A9930|nr:hypothetical protein [Noviherbaspirillum galbum]